MQSLHYYESVTHAAQHSTWQALLRLHRSGNPSRACWADHLKRMCGLGMSSGPLTPESAAPGSRADQATERPMTTHAAVGLARVRSPCASERS
jgi:hypothetical protein